MNSALVLAQQLRVVRRECSQSVMDRCLISAGAMSERWIFVFGEFFEMAVGSVVFLYGGRTDGYPFCFFKVIEVLPK